MRNPSAQRLKYRFLVCHGMKRWSVLVRINLTCALAWSCKTLRTMSEALSSRCLMQYLKWADVLKSLMSKDMRISLDASWMVLFLMCRVMEQKVSRGFNIQRRGSSLPLRSFIQMRRLNASKMLLVQKQEISCSSSQISLPLWHRRLESCVLRWGAAVISLIPMHSLSFGLWTFPCLSTARKRSAIKRCTIRLPRRVTKIFRSCRQILGASKQMPMIWC